MYLIFSTFICGYSQWKHFGTGVGEKIDNKWKNDLLTFRADQSGLISTGSRRTRWSVNASLLRRSYKVDHPTLRVPRSNDLKTSFLLSPEAAVLDWFFRIMVHVSVVALQHFSLAHRLLFFLAVKTGEMLTFFFCASEEKKNHGSWLFFGRNVVAFWFSLSKRMNEAIFLLNFMTVEPISIISTIQRTAQQGVF